MTALGDHSFVEYTVCRNNENIKLRRKIKVGMPSDCTGVILDTFHCINFNTTATVVCILGLILFVGHTKNCVHF